MPFRDAFPILHTTDLKRAARFYVERLGFEERYRFPEGEAAEFVLVGLETFELGLTKSRKVTPPGRVALWLYTEDVDAEIEQLHEAGVEVVKEPEDMEWGERMASVLDPDGNKVFIGERLTR